MITSIQLETYQIPKFYTMLEEFGIQSIPPQSDYEAYRGELDGAKIIIKISGQVMHTDDRRIQEIIDLVMDEISQEGMTQEEISDGKSLKYMILAKHSTPPSYSYPINHLNIWVNQLQYKKAVELFLEHDEIRERETEYEFEDYRFKLGGRVIRFHENGKIIAEDGYAQFGSILTEAIQHDLPFSEYELIIGQDEVGNGEYIGPLVVGTVAATPEQLIDLQLIGVKDSKMVPRGIIPSMTHWIRQTATIGVTQQIVPIKFNQMRLENQRAMGEILTELHNQTIEKMKDKLRQLGIADKKTIYIVDQYDKYEQLTSLEDEKHMDIEVKYLPHAEQQSISVAAGSLLAKYDQIRWVQLHEKVHNIALKRKELNKIRQHEKAHQLLKSM